MSPEGNWLYGVLSDWLRVLGVKPTIHPAAGLLRAGGCHRCVQQSPKLARWARGPCYLVVPASFRPRGGAIGRSDAPAGCLLKAV